MTNEREKNAYDQLLQGVQSFVKKCVNSCGSGYISVAFIDTFFYKRLYTL